MILSDFHMHTSYSSDSETFPEKQVLSSIHNHLESICITDHMDFDFPVGEDGYTFLFDMDDYVFVLKKIQSKFQKEISIKIGVELGVMPHIGKQLSEFTQKYRQDLDFIIASSHLVNKIDPYDTVYFNTYSEQEGTKLYLQTIIDNLNSFTDFDVYGHLDYVVRYTPSKGKHYNPLDYMDYYDLILRRIIELGKGIELNTAGLKAGLGFAHPHPKVLKRYQELGGEIITIGSDAHQPEYVAYEFQKAADILKDTGFRYYTTFDRRNPSWHKL